MRTLLTFAASAAISLAALSSAQAADVFGGQPSGSSGHNWTGAYIGVFGGVTDGEFDYSGDYTDGFTAAEGDIATIDGDGLVGGAQIGYDFQFGNVVLGAVADIALSDHEASISERIEGFGSADLSSELQYLGTVRARLGYGFNRFMVYGHGGLAYGETEQRVAVRDAADDLVLDETFETGDTKFGYAVGAGLEYLVLDNVSIQGEYSYVDLGADDLYSGPLFGGDRARLEEEVTFHTFKAGINYRF